MKQTNTFIVMRAKDGSYLAEFKNNQFTLAYNAGFTDYLNSALIMTEESYEDQREDFEALAKMVECEPIRVQAEYTLTTLDGSEPAEAVKDAGPENLMRLMDLLKRGNFDSDGAF